MLEVSKNSGNTDLVKLNAPIHEEYGDKKGMGKIVQAL